MSSQQQQDDEKSILNSRQLEAFSRTVHATASQLITGIHGHSTSHSDTPAQDHYRSALSSVRRFSQRPTIQRSVFSFAKANPRELIRSNFNTVEIEHRALTYLPDELIRNVPASSSPFSLLDGFRASLPDEVDGGKSGRRSKHGRHSSRGRQLLENAEQETLQGPPKLQKLKRDKDRLEHRLEMMGVRKTMCTSEIREIDNKIANLNTMRKVILGRLAGLEDEERELELEVMETTEKLEVMEEELADEAVLAQKTSKLATLGTNTEEATEDDEEKSEDSPGFMSESVYEKLPKVKETPPKTKRKKVIARRISMPVLHEHMEPGSRIREIPAHNDTITALDFDAPFGTMVTAALDDTVRVWDLNAGRCMGMLEGHLSSVRCLQVEENIVATGSMDASIRLWDLSQADYSPSVGSNISSKSIPEEAEGESADPATGEDLYTPTASESGMSEARGNGTQDCHMFTLSSHMAEVTALNFHGSKLVSGSADKTIREWDLVKGRCVQTLDVLWAAAQAATLITPVASAVVTGTAADGNWWKPTGGRLQNAEADFIGALQVFDTALACGTADGMVRMWDLRSGQVHRQLVGHTGPVTALQFDDMFVVTASQDRSVRIWDLRTGNIHDAFAYDAPITSMQFDTRRIVAAAGEDVVKVYDKTEGSQWDCGAGTLKEEEGTRPSIVERVRIRDGYLIEGRRDGVVGVWSC